MNEGRGPIAVEELLAQSGWLAALARRLVVDEHRADDLVQQVWLQTIERPPRREGSVRGWLRAALRSRWRDEQRADASRTARERAGFAERAAPSTAEIAVRVEAQQAVARAVLELPEPLRGVVLLHFFEELTLRETARRLGIPYETARDRLARALDALRRRLREERGDDDLRGLALILCVDGRGGASPSHAVARRTSRWTASKTAVGVAVVMTLGLVAGVALDRRDAKSGAQPSARVGAVVATPTARADGGDSARAAVVAAKTGTSETEDVGGTHSARADIRILTIDGDAVAGAPVEAWALPPGGDGPPAKTRVAATDAAGRARFAGLVPGRWTFVVRAAGHAAAAAEDRGLAAGDVREFTLFVGTGRGLAGRVVDEDGRGVAGATVVAAPPRAAGDAGVASLRVAVATDADGRYELRDLPSGETTLWAALPGGEPSPIAVVVLPAVTRFDLALRRGGALRGRVLDAENGAPVAGAEVRARGSGATGTVFGRATTDADGRFVLDALLECDVLQIVAAKDGYGGDAQAAADAPSFVVAPPRGAVVSRDLVQRRGGRVSGRVTRADAPVAGAAVTARFANRLGEWVVRATTTGDDGRYVVEHAGPGQVVVRVESPGLRESALADPKVADSISLAPFTVEVPERGDAAFDVALDVDPAPPHAPACIHGTVVAQDGASREFWVEIVGGAPRRVLAGPGGAFEIDVPPRAPTATLRVRATSVDSADVWSEELAPESPGGPAPVRLVAAPGVAWTGVVRSGAGGASVAGASVRISSPRENGRFARTASGRAAPVAATTGADGRFAVPHLRPGTYQVVAAAEGFVESAATVEIPAKEASVLELAPALDIAGRVEFDDGAPLAGVHVTAGPAARNDASAAVARGAQAGVAEDGSFTLRGLAAGLYRIRVDSPWNPALSFLQTSAAEAEAGARDVRVAVRRALDISGRVLDAAGRPAKGVFVQLATTGPKPSPALTDADGAFVFRNLVEGVYGVEARTVLPGVEPAVARRDGVVAGARGLELVLAPALSIEGALVDADGKPVAGAAVGVRPVGRLSADVHEFISPAGADGRFVLRGLAPGTYEITAVNLRDRAKPFVVRGAREFAAGATGLRLEIRPALDVTGRLIDDQGAALANRTVEFVPDDPAWPRRRARTDAAGRFDCAGLGPGRHRAECLDDADASVRAPCGECDAGAADVELRRR